MEKKRADFAFEIREDEADFSINGEKVTLKARQLDELISYLAVGRAQMKPPYPQEAPQGDLQMSMGARWRVTWDKRQKGALVQLCHAAFGWLNYCYTPEQTDQLIDGLQQAVDAGRKYNPPASKLN